MSTGHGHHHEAGGGEEFHTIEIGDLTSGAAVASEPQLMPTSYDPDSLSFVSVPSATDEEISSSTIASAPPPASTKEASWGSIKPQRPQGRLSQYLDSKGFGFLLEVEEEEGEEEQKPLL